MGYRNRNRSFNGHVVIGKYSTLRKLMRATRRNKIPDERLVIINMAMRKAREREARTLRQTI